MIPHLNVRTSYSLLSSLITFDKYFNYATKNGLSTLAICDSNMFGVYEFHQLAQKNNIKPIIGLNVTILFNNEPYNLNLFARNQKGYFNLVEISSLIMINAEHKTTLTFDDLSKFLTTGLKIIINYSAENYQSTVFQTLKDNLVNPKDLFLGINNGNVTLLDSFLGLGPEEQIIWNNKVQYFTSDDFTAYKVVDTIKTQTLFKESKLYDLYAWVAPPSRYDQYFENIKQFITDIEIFPLNKGTIFDNLLQYPIPDGETAQQFLAEICQTALKAKKLNGLQGKYEARLSYELDVINKMGFNDYFLIVWDYVRYAKQQNVFVGPGRGSAAGSLVSYLLDITTIDPIAYNLLFERFLNPERKSLPDIDIDFQDDKREMIVEYLFEKYGSDHVAHIVTFQTIGMKMAIRDICRIFDIAIDEADKMSKAVPLEYNYHYEQAISSNPVFEIYQKKYPQVFLHLKKIIGLPRQTGTHAAGVVLTQQRLQEIIPVKEGYNGIYQTQYSMNYLEELGILKMDLLGLRNLTILHDVVDNIYQETKIKLDVNKLPLNDQKTYHLLAQGDTKGIFQLESPGMTKVLVDMVPDQLEDIVATSSLYRPGPQDNIPLFIQRKKHLTKVTYIDDRLTEILAPTYGIIVYQEQVMLIAQKVANFTLAKADVLRRAMGKKDASIMGQMKTEFIKEAIKNHYVEKTAHEIWELIYKFAAYGFNRSHAVAYSLLGYQMAYLKANYPSQFLASLLTNVIGDEHKTNDYIALAKKNHLTIVPPNINAPYRQYHTIDNQICVPLLIIKQIGFAFFKKIASEYQENGPFVDLYDLFIRLYKKGLNRKTYEALCFSGALDLFKMNRITLFNNYQRIITYIELIKTQEENENLVVDFSLAEKPELVIEPDDEVLALEKEYEFLGFYLSNHPLKYIREKEGYQLKTTLISNLRLNLGSTNVLVLVKRLKVIIDKNNNKMAFLDCYDESGEISITAFAGIYKDYANLLKVNNILLLNIKLGTYNNKINGIINRIKFISGEQE
ncbi:DNA polymerase III subunit alpha [Spiroplasma sp. SV19]|uniref:DNA polymerase III subunit alpha n=1 Tax=Spiroplasma sp. SV19 TaxID=2570468 RepID=UPI0024B74084|nr:DNA polymerase III subunit alpha [Spiroplasma sp. SV19]